MTSEVENAPAPAVEVRRNAWLLGGIGVAAALVGAAYLGRAAGPGGATDWVLAAVLAGVAVAYLVAFVDARVPLMVADETGARVRRGRTWIGLPWHEVDRVVHRPRRGWLRDGRLALLPAEGATSAGRFSVPLGLATTVLSPSGPLDRALGEIVPPGRFHVEEPQVEDADVDVDAEHRHDADVAEPAPGPTASEPGSDAGPTRPAGAVTVQAGSAPSPPPVPGRDVVPPRRTDLVVGSLALQPSPDQVTVALPELEQLRRPSFPELDVVEGEEPEPLPEPVIGPQLAAARRRLSLTVPALAERTRIRAHVIEAIEADDFAPCGGDFYARGHLRTLARVLGIDATDLVATFDERYTHAPVTPREVFQAELATGATASLRSTRGGPNWTVLVAALMAVVLAWSVARLVMDGPVDVPVAPRLDGSSGVNKALGTTSDAVPVVIRAAGGGAHVIVRDGNGRIIFTGDLAYGASRSMQVAPPVRIESSDGSVEVVLDGREEGKLGETGEPAAKSFVAG